MNIVEKFKAYGLFKGNELYIKIVFVSKFIDECNKVKLAVIGIEGFRSKDKILEPQLGMIADFSGYMKKDWENCLQLCNQAASKFLEAYLGS